MHSVTNGLLRPIIFIFLGVLMCERGEAVLVQPVVCS